MTAELPIVEIVGIRFYVDERLTEIRAVDNPHFRCDLNERQIELVLDLFQVESRKERYTEPYPFRRGGKI